MDGSEHCERLNAALHLRPQQNETVRKVALIWTRVEPRGGLKPREAQGGLKSLRLLTKGNIG